jgi:hypothetical protein
MALGTVAAAGSSFAGGLYGGTFIFLTPNPGPRRPGGTLLGRKSLQVRPCKAKLCVYHVACMPLTALVPAGRTREQLDLFKTLWELYCKMLLDRQPVAVGEKTLGVPHAVHMYSDRIPTSTIVFPIMIYEPGHLARF